MMENLKDKINRFNVILPIIESLYNNCFDIVRICQIVKPEYNFFNKTNIENIELIEFKPDNIFNNLLYVFNSFGEVFFNNDRFLYISELERQYIKKIYDNLYATGNEEQDFLLGLFTSYQKSLNFGNNFLKPDKILPLLEDIINILSKFHKLKTLEQKKCIDENLFKLMANELNLISESLNISNQSFDYIKKYQVSLVIKKDIIELDNKIQISIKNSYFNIYTSSIANSIKHILELSEQNIIIIKDIYRLIDIFEQEIIELIRLRDQEQILLDEMNSYLESTQAKRSNLKNSQKIKEFKEDINAVRNLSKVYAQAKDPTTAIKHSEKGKELQMYFLNQEAQKVIEEYKEENIKANSIKSNDQKSDINKWFKYGIDNREEVKKETNLRTTSFGMNIKDMLKENGLDESILSSINNKKNN